MTTMSKKKKQIGPLVRLSPTVHAQLKQICATEGRTMSFMANWLIGRWVAHNHPEVISEPKLGTIPGPLPKGAPDAE